MPKTFERADDSRFDEFERDDAAIEMFLSEDLVGALQPFPRPIFERCVKTTRWVPIEPVIDDDSPGLVFSAVTAICQPNRNIGDNEPSSRLTF